MVSFNTFRQEALQLPGVTEQPHFDLISFRVQNKIFATYWEKDNRAMLKLPLVEQSVFCTLDNAIFFPVPGGWGKQGATFVELGKVGKTVFKDALRIAYQARAANPGIQKKKSN